MTDMPMAAKIAVSILAGAIMVARSPSSAIAIVVERAAAKDFNRKNCMVGIDLTNYNFLS
jgi:hypothetical protein